MAGLRVEVRRGDIVVTLPGTSYRAVYHKPADKPGLIATSRMLIGKWRIRLSRPTDLRLIPSMTR
jgi:hypothetical protein